jgi:hypothetical protein
MDDGTILPTVSRTNNALEHYNQRSNKLFNKKPSLMEFILVVEEESHHHAQKLQNIRTWRAREVECSKVWVPEITMSYCTIKSGFKSKEDKEDGSGNDNLPIHTFAPNIKKNKEVKSKKKDEGGARKVRSNKILEEKDSNNNNLPIIHVL